MLSFCSASAPMWWLVTISPSAETNAAGAAVVEPHRRQPGVLEPGVGQVEAVLLLEQLRAAGR